MSFQPNNQQQIMYGQNQQLISPQQQNNMQHQQNEDFDIKEDKSERTCYENCLQCGGSCFGCFRAWCPCICCCCPNPF